MAHVVGAPRPEIVYSREIDGGAGYLIDCRTRRYVELSSDASAVIEVDRSTQARLLAIARAQGIAEAAQEADLAVRLAIQ